jgi:hypothetical protein
MTNNDFQDFSPCSIVASDYKWLTETLKTAQQSPAVRPYFSCKILDDKIVPTAILSTSVYPRVGSVITAPDGNVLAVGEDSDGYFSFWKITDASQTSQWSAPTKILDDLGSYANALNCAISVSEYINGTYRIDVYYFVTYLGDYKIVHQYSDDGGTTWTKETSIVTGVAIGGVAYIAAGKPYQDISGTVQSIFFFTEGANIKYASSAGSWTMTSWTATNSDTQDWIIHSLDSYFQDGIYYIVFSAYHNYLETTNGMYSIYQTSLKRVTDLVTTDVWGNPIEILSSLSSSIYNQNTFKYPKINYDGTYYWLMFQGDIVQSITSASISTIVNYFLCKSKNLKDFSYPASISFTDGTVFSDTLSNNFFKQGNYYYISGNGKLWQYTNNNLTADISVDVSQITIKENAGNPSTLVMTVGNQNGKWVGASPTGVNYQAIAKDRKVLLDLGYYNVSGVAETAPRNIFYIDDINQNVTVNMNELTISARDFHKKTRVTTSKISYNYNGVSAYKDIFDGTTISNWNQKNGNWHQNTSAWITLSAYGVESYDTNFEYNIILAKQFISTPNSLLSVTCLFPDPESSPTVTYCHVYPFYQDSDNWIRLEIQSYGTAPTLLDSYSETYQDIVSNIYAGYTPYYGQSFTNTYASTLDSCKFYIQKYGSPTGNANAILYAHTGTYGTNGKPTGLQIAISDNFDVSTLTTSLQLITFTFSGINRASLSAATHYCIELKYDSGDSSNCVQIGGDSSTPSALGNGNYSGDGATWTAISGTDYCFYVYGILTTPSWYAKIYKNIAGTKSPVFSGFVPSTNGFAAPYPIIIRKTNYYTFSFEVGANNNNLVNSYDPSTMTTYITSQDFSADFISGAFKNGTVGFGSQNFTGKFSLFKYIQYSNSQSIEQLSESVATKADIYNYKYQKYWEDKLFDSSVWTGTFTSVNRQLVITANNMAVKTKIYSSDATNLSVSNGEVEFEAKLTPTNSALDYGMDFLFRNSSSANDNNGYTWRTAKKDISASPVTLSKLIIKQSGQPFIISTSSEIDYLATSNIGNLNIDLTIWHTYKLVMSDGWMHGFIDNVLVVSWNDDNISQVWTTGYIGFKANANTTIKVRNIKSGVFWNQIESFVINPGDDIETSTQSVIGILRGWIFSDLMGRAKTKILQSTDISEHTYQNEIIQQQTDNSDKEYINQITVIGSGVSAIAKDDISIANTGRIRDAIVVDYKILTYADALTRAQYELKDTSKFSNQSNPRSILNVGSEILDVVTIINTGVNSSNVNSSLRVYNQNLNIGGGNKSTGYSEEIETGNL